MIWVCASLYGLGGILPLGALFVGWRRLRAAHRQLTGQLAEIQRIQSDKSLSSDERTARAYEILRPEGTWGHVLYVIEWTREAIMSNALADLRGPAWWGATGVVCGTVASVWSLWL